MAAHKTKSAARRSDGAGTRTGQVQSVRRALDILEELSRHDGGLSLSELARHVGLPASTTHRLLTTLEGQRYVAFDQRSTRWSVGLQSFIVGATFSRARDLVRLGRPVMKMLMEESRETVNISIADDNRLVYVTQVEAAHALSTFARPGAQVPLYSSASGKAMMAYWSDQDLSRYLSTVDLSQITAKTISDPATLVEELRQVREQGFATDNEENCTGIRCVAAPVFDECSEPVAAISISGPKRRLPKERLPDLGPQVCGAGLRMTQQIGGCRAEPSLPTWQQVFRIAKNRRGRVERAHPAA